MNAICDSLHSNIQPVRERNKVKILTDLLAWSVASLTVQVQQKQTQK
jgi:hypothetical protein